MSPGTIETPPFDCSIRASTFPPAVRCRDDELDSDQRIEQRARAALEVHPHFHGRGQWLKLRCRHGCLRLSGKLPSWYLKQLAQEAVRGVAGVQRIANQICVASPSAHVCGPEPEWIARRSDRGHPQSVHPNLALSSLLADRYLDPHRKPAT